MQPLANKFIELLESKQLLSDEVIEELRRQVAESKVKLSPELIAKLLVDNGHLTKFQATKLVAELTSSAAGPTTQGTDEGDELGLAPTTSVAEVVLDDDDDDVVDVESVDVVDDAVEVVDVEPVVEVVEAVEAVEVQSFEPDSVSSPLATAPPSARPVKIAKSKANPWDSFRILGVGVVLALVCIAGFFLVRWMLRGSAEDAIKRADDAYEQRSYETATNMYGDFSKNWPTNEKASYAKVRAALSELRKDVEGGANPVVGLRTAEKVLPSVTGESSLSEQQSDLAGVLVSLAEKFTTRLDQTKENDQRKELMSDFEKLMSLINDPQYVGTAQRTQQAPTLLKIEESRSRLNREIGRDDELTSALKEIDSLLEANDVLKAYEVRKQLINRYPLLEVNDQLQALVAKASAIQQKLVTDSSTAARILPVGSVTEAAKSYLFANRSGQSVSELTGTIVYYRVKGTVYGINASSGELLWTKFVGRNLDTHPVRLGDSPNPDVLVTEASQGRVHRLVGETGEIKWTVDFAEPVHNPVFDGDDLVVTTHSGKIANLDPISGQTKWFKQLPQPTNVSPCVTVGKPSIYQPADHSNIYVLDRRDGSCTEVYYSGHKPGSIKVPPVLLMGQLFAIENISNDAARIRIMGLVDGHLRNVQNAIPIEGNVVNTPVIDRRQLLVQSDLGNTLVLDVEPSAETEKVTVTARVPKNFDLPHETWLAFDKNIIWLADDRLSKFDLIVSQGKLKGQWVQNEGDAFIAPMQLFGRTLIHARRARGNQGVRISAVQAGDGARLWDLDIGEPISMIAKKSAGGFATVTSSGNYYSIAGKPLTNQADVAAGEGKNQKWFTHPVWYSATDAVMLNNSNAREFALYSEGKVPLRVMAVPLGSSVPSCPGVAVGDKIVVGLENGQLVMFDPTTGSLVGSPYQPALRPNAKIRWNQPVYLPDSQTLVIASDLKQIVRLGAGESLRQLSEEPLDSPLIGPLALVGNAIAGVKSTNAADQLLMFNSNSLASQAGAELEGKLIAGPFSGTEMGVLQTDKKLVTFDANGSIQWATDFPNSQIVGTPQTVDGSLIVGNRLGQIWVLNAQSGAVVGNIDLGQPLSCGPMVVDKRLLIGSDEGSILATQIPTSVTIGGGQNQ